MGIISKILNKLKMSNIKYEPLIEVRVFKDAILHNLKEYQKKYPQVKFAPVLKSNAYGHGLVEVAKILDLYNHPHLTSPLKGEENKVMPFFMVDSFYEALVLRRAGIKTKVLVLGYVRNEQILNNKLKDVSFGIIDIKQLEGIAAKLNTKQSFHLKIDTGMHRQGVLLSEVPSAIALIKSNPNFILEGVCTHFADADGKDYVFTEKQIEEWNKVVKSFRDQFPEIKFYHASNSAGAFFAPKIDANVSRLGIGLYGFNQSPFEQMNLLPALEMVSFITTIKTIPSGDKVGYNIMYTVPSEIRVATFPVGYYEGLDRRLSNIGFVKVKGVFCPIVGRISMNMCSIDVTNVKDLKLEDEVVIISKNLEDKNSIDNMIKLSGSTAHEFRVHIPQHLRRIIL